MREIYESWNSFWDSLLSNAILMGIRNALKFLLENIEIPKKESVIVHENFIIFIFPFCMVSFIILLKKFVSNLIIIEIPVLVNAIILGIHNILEVLLQDIGILKMETTLLHTNITIIPHSVLYVSLSYYIINPCTSASSNFDDSFS